MNTPPKHDAHKIRAFLDGLKRQEWLGDRKVWVDYLFHFTHLENAASILKCGFLYSRAELNRQSVAFSDSASSQVINQSHPELADQVRFYFRPRTPTTYHMEGFKPVDKRFHDAHCAMPVYLLFDMKGVISLNKTRFSDGNLASEYSSLFSSADEFTQLPFGDIYHDGPYHEEDRYLIRRTRQAEVIYPKKISLEHLKYIYCRSQAEMETLRNLLPVPTWRKWESKVLIARNPHELFQMRFLHVSEAALNTQSINLDLHAPTEPAWFGPFDVKVFITNSITRREFQPIQRRFTNIVWELPSLRLIVDVSDIGSKDYTAKVTIDDELAYLGQYDEIPF